MKRTFFLILLFFCALFVKGHTCEINQNLTERLKKFTCIIGKQCCIIILTNYFFRTAVLSELGVKV